MRQGAGREGGSGNKVGSESQKKGKSGRFNLSSPDRPNDRLTRVKSTAPPFRVGVFLTGGTLVYLSRLLVANFDKNCIFPAFLNIFTK